MDVIGYLMIATPFIALFIWSAFKTGIRETSIIFGLAFIVLLWMALAQYFIELS